VEEIKGCSHETSKFGWTVQKLSEYVNI
jgi:hypothetical protein